MKGLEKKCKTLMKKIKDLNKWRDKSYLWFGRPVLLRGQFSPRINVKIQHSPNKNPSMVFIEIKELIVKFIWKDKRPRIAKTILKILLEASHYLIARQATVIETVWY